VLVEQLLVEHVAVDEFAQHLQVSHRSEVHVLTDTQPALVGHDAQEDLAAAVGTHEALPGGGVAAGLRQRAELDGPGAYRRHNAVVAVWLGVGGVRLW
jgi:hypothetical protein